MSSRKSASEGKIPAGHNAQNQRAAIPYAQRDPQCAPDQGQHEAFRKKLSEDLAVRLPRRCGPQFLFAAPPPWPTEDSQC